VFTRTEQYITRMKLRELGRQRERLRDAYRRLRQEARAADDDGRKLRLLYDGLRRIKFADRSLHPDVANLDPILVELEVRGQAPAETVAFWRGRLEKELDAGELRAEIVYVFGALLEEWAGQDGSKGDAGAIEQSRSARADLLDAATRPAIDEPAPALGIFLDALFETQGLNADELGVSISQVIDRCLQASVDSGDALETALRTIGGDKYRSSLLRQEARSVLLSPVLRKEFTDALTIMLDSPGGWTWPEAGIPTRAYWTPNKWRLFLDEDLPTACLVEIFGIRLQEGFAIIFSGEAPRRLQRIRRLLNAKAPLAALQREVSLFGRSMGLDSLDEGELWIQDDPREKPDTPVEPVSTRHLERLYQGGATRSRLAESILQQRRTLKALLGALEDVDLYGGDEDDEMGGPELAAAWIHAEIQLARAAFPDQPVYVIKVDFKDYYASLPHDALLAILARFGLSRDGLDFFRTYMRIPLQRPGREETAEPASAQRGVANGRRLSDLLGDLVLRLLDRFVQGAAPVRVIRSIDDICLIAASPVAASSAWQAVEVFADACGLTLNRDKCGAVVIGAGDAPTDLPTTPPTWLLLALDRNGDWRVHMPAFDAFLDQTRQQVRQARSIVAQAQVYNAAVTYLERALAVRAPLGETHRQSIGAAMLRFQRQLLDDTRGILDLLRESIRERFLGDGSSVLLPEAWLCWPLTAGGLGLTQTSVLATSFAQGFARRQQPRIPEEGTADWQRGAGEWGGYFRLLAAEVKASGPAQRQVMEALVGDFIARGSELTDGNQTGLSPYWRWVLYIYGPQILDDLGSFRFLITELVPLQLINQKYGHGDAEDGSSPDAAEASADTDDIPF